MTSYIILLRGVTPTGKNKVLMGPLRTALEQAGFEDVRTYIQSGNILASSNLNRPGVENVVHEVIEQNFGGDITVMARTPAQFREILAGNPFKNADTAKLYYTLLAATPDQARVKEFLAPGYLPDQVEVIGDLVYTLCATKYRDLKVNNNFIERKLKVAATTRNYNTMTRLEELAGQ